MASKAARQKGTTAKTGLPDLSLPNTNGAADNAKPSGAGGNAAAAATVSPLLESDSLMGGTLGFDAMANSMLDDDDTMDGTDLETVKLMLSKFAKSREQKTQAKQRKMLQEVQAGLEQQVKVLEAAVAKDAKEAKAIATSSFDAALHKLQDKYASLEALNKRYQQQLHSLWQEYDEIYTRAVEATKTEVLAIASKKRTALKRKIQQAQSHCTEQLQDAEKKVAKLKTSSKKLPDITSVLQAFMA